MSDGSMRSMPWPLLATAALLGGLAVGISAANVWPALLLSGKLSVSAAAVVEVLFLAAYLLIFSGWAPGPWRRQRLSLGRGRGLSRLGWRWGVLAAVSFAVVVHSAIVLLFRWFQFPAEAFHRGYDISWIPTLPLQWLVCVVSALSAGVCEEMGFRGYLQQPLEARFGPAPAILVSALLFTLLHLNKSWLLAPMTPIVFAAGLLLGMLAQASGTLVFCILGHWIMDIGLFAYWWTQIAGKFSQKPLSVSGIDQSFFLELGVFCVSLTLLFIAMAGLRGRQIRNAPLNAATRQAKA